LQDETGYSFQERAVLLNSYNVIYLEKNIKRNISNDREVTLSKTFLRAHNTLSGQPYEENSCLSDKTSRMVILIHTVCLK
jgi:hypothetical protein